MIDLILKILAVYASISLLILFLMAFLPSGWLVQEYPKEWEEEENRLLKDKFDNYKEKNGK